MGADSAMGVYYRLLGVAARINETLRHTLVNGLPLNWALLFAVSTGLLFSSVRVHEAVTHGGPPVPTSLDAVVTRRTPLRNFVVVTGELHPEAGLVIVKCQRFRVEEFESMIVPMLDDRRKSALLVTTQQDLRGRPPQVTTVTGMLRPLSEEVEAALREQAGQDGFVPLHLETTLVEGERPGSHRLWGAVAALSALVLVLFGSAQLRRNVIFRRMGPEPLDTRPSTVYGSVPTLRVSGRFVREKQRTPRWKRVLNEFLSGASRSRWFLDVPATMALREPGELAFLSYLDPSLRFMGIRLEDRSGIWALVLKRDGLRALESGRLYLGFATWPALRIRYIESPSGRRRWAVVRFANEGEREVFLVALGEVVGHDIRLV
jgi:hypothetical protein